MFPVYRIVFMGTPQIAVPTLENLLDSPHELVGVFTQPDKPAGRGKRLHASPVKELAQRHEIPVFQPRKAREPEAIEQMRELQPDLVVVAAYGHILPKEMLEIATHGFINVHVSLLPKYRGAAPIQWALLNGEAVTGTTIMLIDEGMDSGDMLLQEELEIGRDEDAISLAERSGRQGARLVQGAIGLHMREARWHRTPQNHDEATFAPMIKKEQGAIRWEEPAPTIHNQVRALVEWPKAWAMRDGARLVILQTRVVEHGGSHGAPGEIVRAAKGEVHVACGEGLLSLMRLQPEGKKPWSAADFINGAKVRPGERLENG